MATNNNLIPINIKDLPKLDILSNSDLIPIETVEGTATILYRDFIIDEAHTTFAATLSASVTSAINLSAAIDTTNATVKTVSASLYSSITALSSSSFAYSNALSSSIVSLNATVTALSANVNALSSTVAVNTTNIISLSSSVNDLRTTIVAVTGSQPVHYVNTSSTLSSGSGITSIFGESGVSLAGSSFYRLQCSLIYFKNLAGTVTFSISSSNTITRLTGRIIHSRFTDSDTLYGATSGATLDGGTVSTFSFPATYALNTSEHQFADIDVVMQTNLSSAVILNVNASAGSISPTIGSRYTVTKLT